MAEKNASTLGLESFLGGQAGEAGEIELAKIRIANLLAQKAELEREARELEAKRKERAANLVSADSPEVIALLKQIAELKAQIAKLSAEEYFFCYYEKSSRECCREFCGEYFFCYYEKSSRDSRRVYKISLGNS